MKATERKCHSCGGYGTILFDGLLRDCKTCKGRGKIDMPTGIKRIVSIQELIESPNEIKA
jgi:DnaJ-class molecular chaperone